MNDKLKVDGCCPHCGSRHFHRSRRRGIWERLFLRMLRFRIYRCERCYKRFYSKTVHSTTVVEN